MGKFIKTTIQEFLNENYNSELIEMLPNTYVYHTSNPLFRDNISKEGLIPHGKGENWLSDTKIDGKVIFATNSDNSDDWVNWDYDDDIYRIDTTGLMNKWYYDPNFGHHSNYIITFDEIPASSIELIHEGTGLDLSETQ